MEPNTTTTSLVSSSSEQIYSCESDVFLRETGQNSCDAITVRQLTANDPEVAEPRGRIDFFYDEVARKVINRDNGIGADKSVLNLFEKKLAKISHSFPGLPGTVQDELKKRIIGRFGMGLLSTLRVADTFTLFSRKGGKWYILRLVRSYINGEEDYKFFEEEVEDCAGAIELELLEGLDYGTVVSISLKREDQTNKENHTELRVLENANKISSARKIIASLQKYFLYLPPNMDLYVDGRLLTFKEPELGYCDFVDKGKEDDVAYKIGIPSFTTISQKNGELAVYVKGVLVQENYEKLVPDFLHAIRGYINIESDQYSGILSRSREQFIEHDKLFLKLKDLVHSIVVNMCSKWIDDSVKRPSIDVSADRSVNIVNLYETWGRDRFRKSDADYALKLFGAVVSLKVIYAQQERDMSLKEISELCGNGSIKKIYFMTDDCQFVSQLITIDKINLYTKKTDHYPFFLQAKKEGNVAFISYRSTNQNMTSEIDRVLRICNDYLAKVGKCSVTIKPLSSDMIEPAKDVPSDMGSDKRVFVNLSDQPKLVFIGCNPMTDRVYINRNAEVVERFLKLLKKIDKDKRENYIDIFNAITAFKQNDALETLVGIMDTDT